MQTENLPKSFEKSLKSLVRRQFGIHGWEYIDEGATVTCTVCVDPVIYVDDKDFDENGVGFLSEDIQALNTNIDEVGTHTIGSFVSGGVWADIQITIKKMPKFHKH
jgi:hypothetical protein